MGLRWISPRGQELWSSTAELTVGTAAGHVGELDMPVIAAIDLPLDGPGCFRMLVELDGEVQTEVTLHVHGPVNLPPGRPTGAMVS
jgi:hypothetical protein